MSDIAQVTTNTVHDTRAYAIGTTRSLRTHVSAFGVLLFSSSIYHPLLTNNRDDEFPPHL